MTRVQINIREVREIIISPREDKVPRFKIIRFSMFNRYTFEQLQREISNTFRSLSEQCEIWLKCCTTKKCYE